MGGFQPAVRMSRDRKCILCETVYVSKQEMDEHMRTMLHHRELEKLKGRDCGHECRVCKLTVVSLTDYASHISSPTHKKNVEAVERKHAPNDHDEDYFDQALVDLIEKRKELMRKEKEASAAKLAKEEEDRRKKEEFQKRLAEAKERFQQERGRQQPPQGFGRPNQHSSWHSGSHHSARGGGAPPWHNSQQGKSNTWHAQPPPNFQRWGAGDLRDGRSNTQQGWGNNQWDQEAFCGQGRLPWLSNGGSSNGVYGRNNISQYQQRNRPPNFFGSSPMYPPPPLFANAVKQNTGNDHNQPGGGLQNGEILNPECDHSSSKSSKTFGSNPKLDKTSRWTPYPVTKGLDSIPHKDTSSKLSEKHPKVSKSQTQQEAPEGSALNKNSQQEQKTGQFTSGGKSGEEKGNLKKKSKSKPSERSSSGAQKDGQQTTSSGPSNQKAKKLPDDRKPSSVPGLTDGPPHLQGSSQSKTTTKQSGIKASPVGPLQINQGRKQAKDVVLEKRGSLDGSTSTRLEKARQTVEEQLKDHATSQIGGNKENSCRHNAAKPTLSDSARGSIYGEEGEKPASSFSSQFLQSLQVSTSTLESSEPASSSREDQENVKTAGKETGSVAPGEAMQATEAGLGSESDTSRSDEAQTVSSLTKIDLPPALKRDLSKHISSKNKPGLREPNLNIARRVRNLSGSRRSDTEKDSGLKPTVRQLISSSGSWRNVNWDQVYQEVRKKQDKGKGMPRFGIEMVSCEQEDQSQEEDGIPLLEGFQWESLIDASALTVSRKRSLSESSIAPASIHSLFSSHLSKEMEPRGGLSSEEQRSSISPKDSHQEAEQLLGQNGSKSQKQPDKVTSETVKTLQRADSVLGDSSSGTEQFDGTGKRRRAAGDVLSPEASGPEHDNKRRKTKSKRERSHIDQLLTVSLREEELSRSLQTVDASLIQARAALEAAYLEVQRFMVVKQQMTTEMSTLRNKRIELLKGMQGSLEEAPQIKLKQEKMDTTEAEQQTPASFTFPPFPKAAARGARASPPSPPSSGLSYPSVVIKEEPTSPVRVSSEPNPSHNTSQCGDGVVSELPAASVAASPPDFQPSPERQPELYQATGELESCGEPVDCKEGLSGLVEMTETAVQATRSCLSTLPDSKASIKLLSASRRGSEVGSLAESFESASMPSLINTPPSPSELRGGKRVRKLKKRKVLRKAQGTEQPESSDTELDAEASRPRWLRPRRRPSGGSQVSTSSPPREEDVNMEPGTEASVQGSPHREELLKQATLPGSDPAGLNLESEESMEVTATCQQLYMTPDPQVQVLESSRTDPQSLACNEVTSTSDMDVCRSSESEIPLHVITKASSEASSDHGQDELPTEGLFEGHQEAVNAMQIHDGLLYTCSGDRTVKAFDLVSHKCIAVFEGHTSKVSCLLVSAAPFLHLRLYSGSSDQTIRCYSLKTQEFEQQFTLPDRVVCLHSRWRILYAGLANGTVVTFNLKTNKQMDVFECHGPRAVSCLASSQEGARRILLVGSYDSTISVRDAKNGLLLRTLEGHTKTVLCMKVVNDLVFSGASDQCVYAHNIHTGELVRVYEGHSHAVTVVTILGKVMVTACLDKLVRVYDLQSGDQLQVYGGHKDMVMCMTVHKNTIYTGCYDGSVQAVKLNLMKNYRCWWHGCPLVYGVMEHLQQHLINEHAGTKVQVLKCRWKDCEEFVCTRTSSKRGMILHMQKHAEEETELEH